MNGDETEKKWKRHQMGRDERQRVDEKWRESEGDKKLSGEEEQRKVLRVGRNGVECKRNWRRGKGRK